MNKTVILINGVFKTDKIIDSAQEKLLKFYDKLLFAANQSGCNQAVNKKHANCLALKWNKYE